MSIVLILPWISLRFTSGKCKVNCAVGLIQVGEVPQTPAFSHSEEMAGSRARREVIMPIGVGRV
jgi:hypothetical protein